MSKGSQIIFQHGWGFESSVWNSWIALTDDLCGVGDRGYFGNPRPIEGFLSNQRKKIIVTHSLGIHFISQNVFDNVDCVAILGGFIDFDHADNVLETMKRSIKTSPEEVIDEFYKRCGARGYVSEGTIDAKRLHRDLDFLKSHRLNLEPLKNVENVIIFHGICDCIVPIEKGRALHRKLPNSRLIEFDDGEHSIHTTHYRQCWDIIKETMFKHNVTKNFSRFANQYDDHSSIQKYAADQLMKHIGSIGNPVGIGPILEIGCGTGFVTQKLVKNFPNNNICVTDISKQMIEECKKKIGSNNKISFNVLDGEQLDQRNKYELIVSGFVFQWFWNISDAIQRCIRALQCGGTLIFSLISDDSFPEWKEACKAINVPFTGNKQMKLSQLKEVLSDVTRKKAVFFETKQIQHRTALDCFKSIKNIGGGENKENKTLTYKQMKKLCNYLDSKYSNNVITTYQIIYIKITI